MFMRSKLLTIAFIGLMLPLAPPYIVESRANAQVSKQSRANTDQQAIIKAYRTIVSGLKNKNFNQAYSVHAPEYTAINSEGKVTNLKQLRQNWQRNWQNIHQFVDLGYDFKQIQVSGSTATVLGTGYATVVAVVRNSSGANDLDYKPLSIVIQFQDTWKRTDLGWKITNSRTLQENVTVIQPENDPTLPPPLPDTIEDSLPGKIPL